MRGKKIIVKMKSSVGETVILKTGKLEEKDEIRNKKKFFFRFPKEARRKTINQHEG